MSTNEPLQSKLPKLLKHPKCGKDETSVLRIEKRYVVGYCHKCRQQFRVRAENAKN